MFKTKKIIVAVTVLVSISMFQLSACSKKSDDSKSNGVAVSLKVGQISSNSVSGSSVSSLAFSASDVVPSNNSFSFAHVDGLKISLLEVNLKSGSNYTQAASWAKGTKTLEIGSGVTSAISLSEDISVPAGDYTGAVLRYDNSYSLKAYCRTSSKFLYTSASGVQVLSSTPSSLPSDYDYYSYSFAEVTTAASPTSTSDTAQADTDYPFTVTSAGGQVAVLVDPSFLVTCSDGISSSGSLSPFSWSNNNGYQNSDFFAASAAHFGMSYIPMFVWISGSPTATPPKADTYFIGNASADVTASPIDFTKVSIATVAFNDDGSPFSMRGRILGNSSVDLEQMFNGFTAEAGSTYSVYNGEWMCDDGYVNCRQVQDRKITGFSSTSDYTTVASGTLADGPDCGKTGYFPGHTEWGNRYRSCLGTTSTVYFKKVKK